MRVPFRLTIVASLLAGSAAAQTALKVGGALPDFVLPRVVNRPSGTFTATEATGMVLVLESWSTTCSPCIRHCNGWPTCSSATPPRCR